MSQTDVTEGSQTDATEKTTRDKLIEIVVQNKNVTTEQMANLLNISRRSVAKHTKKLQEEGVIRRVGPDFGGYWEIVKREWINDFVCNNANIIVSREKEK